MLKLGDHHFLSSGELGQLGNLHVTGSQLNLKVSDHLTRFGRQGVQIDRRGAVCEHAFI